jgi:hypothetical protein
MSVFAELNSSSWTAYRIPDNQKHVLYNLQIVHGLPRSDSCFNNLNNHSTVKSRIYYNTVKVNIKFTLEQATEVQRGSRGIVLLFL